VFTCRRIQSSSSQTLIISFCPSQDRNTNVNPWAHCRTDPPLFTLYRPKLRKESGFTFGHSLDPLKYIDSAQSWGRHTLAVPSMSSVSATTQQGPVEARSLSSITAIASNPPAYPRNPTHEKHDPLQLYIVRVPGSQGAFISLPITPFQSPSACSSSHAGLIASSCF
jgi:hypothetical protein